MFELAPNPYSDPIKKFYSEIKGIQWKVPFILQGIQAFVTIIILAILSILYVTVGIVSQISTTFWDMIVGLGEKMNFSQPIESTAYAIALVLYFILFLPFFILQSPVWFGGWLSTKIGFKPFLVITLIFAVSIYIYFFSPDTATNSYAKIIAIQDSITKEYFSSDSLSVPVDSTFVAQELKAEAKQQTGISKKLKSKKKKITQQIK